MTSPIRKKLIEVSIPLEAINAASAHEKMPGIGPHPRGVHLWWARRPLAACRAVLFAQLVDDPSSWPGRYPFPTIANDEASERKRLHRLIERIVPWQASNDEAILDEARWEIARSVAWGRGEEPPTRSDSRAILNYLQANAPPVYDPFSGGGSIPLEAQRLGLRAYGSDLNPVAVLIGKALVEIPPKFAGRPPVNPKAQAELERGYWNGKRLQGLAEDVRYYGQWMRDEAQRRIGHLYPKARLFDGSEATVIAWVWARTVPSPDPAAKGAMVPLVSSFMLSSKDGKKAWIEPVIDATARDGWRFEVKSGPLTRSDEERLRKGTKTARGNFACVLTGAVISEQYNRDQGRAKRLGARLMAIVASGSRERLYISPNPDHEQAAAGAQTEWEPDGDLWDKALGFRVPAYGLKRWADLFTPRQLAVLTTLSDLVDVVRSRVLGDARSSTLREGSTLPTDEAEYADAIATYLGLALDRCADFGNNLTRWSASNEKVMNLFARQAIAMVWDYTEANMLADVVGGFAPATKFVSDCIETLPIDSSGEIRCIDAASAEFPRSDVVISTDPPYFDNIGYADLSDFFYVWLRNSLARIWPELFRRLLTPKDEELVATPFRHGGAGEAEAFFMTGMSKAMTAMRGAAADGGPITIYYAFKQSEAADDGTTSAGWASFLQAVVDSGLAVGGTWPLRSEQAERMRGKGSNALASSIVLVCRRRAERSATVDRAGFTAALRRDLPGAVEKIRAAGVGPVDMQQSVIGPGMGIFTRFAAVLEDDDSTMPVKTALAIINRVWEELDGELIGSLDAETQVALAWFGSYGFEARQSGELITMANAKNTSIDALFESGVFVNLHGKAALTQRAGLPAGWSPLRDRHLTVWECVQHAARVLNDADAGGQDSAALLVAEMGTRATDARALLDRLFRIATEKGWASEALVYNQLAEEWPRLLDRAPAVKPATPEAPDLFAAG